jgi:hypothetical protein
MLQSDIIKHQLKCIKQAYCGAMYEQIKISTEFIHTTGVSDSVNTHQNDKFISSKSYLM